MIIVGQILSTGRLDIRVFGLYFGLGILTTTTKTKRAERAIVGRRMLTAGSAREQASFIAINRFKSSERSLNRQAKMFEYRKNLIMRSYKRLKQLEKLKAPEVIVSREKRILTKRLKEYAQILIDLN